MAFFHLLLLFLLSFSSNSYAQSSSFTPTGNYCNDQKKINPTTQTSVNIDIVLKKLITTTPINGYGAAAAGKVVAGVDRVYGLAQCRGDVNATGCLLCIQDAAKQIRQLCPDQADSRIWYDSCFLRYDTDAFYGEVDTSVGVIYYNVNNVTAGQNGVFERKLGNLMDKLEKKAVMAASKGFGNGKAKLTPFDSIYGMVQCGRDLSPVACAQCLVVAVSNFGGICGSKQGCRVFYSSCYVRYELYPFLDIVSNEIVI